MEKTPARRAFKRLVGVPYEESINENDSIVIIPVVVGIVTFLIACIIFVICSTKSHAKDCTQGATLMPGESCTVSIILPVKKYYCPKNMFRPNCLPISGYTCSDIVEAIGLAENSKKHPYGIMIRTKDPWQVSMNTVKHRVMDFIKEGCPGDFIEYLGLRYSPPNTNPHWVKNVKYFLERNDRENNKNKN